MSQAQPQGDVGARARTLPKRVLEAIARQGLWTPGSTVLVAVSGGLDSTVLLHLLHQLKELLAGSAAHDSSDAIQRVELS